VEETDSDVGAVRPRGLHQVVDLVRDLLLPGEGLAHGLLGRGEVGLRRRDGRDLHPAAHVVDELDEPHRMGPLLLRLAIEEPGELRQGLGVEVGSDGDVLHGSAHLVADLLVEGIDELLAGQHLESPPVQHSITLIARPPREVSLYFDFMSAPVSRMVLITRSRETTCEPSPRSAMRAALIALTDPMALRSMQGIWTSPPTGSQVSPRLCSIPISAAFSTCSLVPPSAATRPPAAIEQATPTSPWQPTSAPEMEAFSLYSMPIPPAVRRKRITPSSSA